MRTPLSKTSALVLICDRDINYQSPKSKEFLSYLDLSEGQKMYDKVKHLQPYIDEAITNRKFLIHNYIRNTLSNHKSSVQVLVMACGWDPILVKISEEFPKHSVFGVDNELVQLQEKIVQKIMPHSSIFYINSDITNTEYLIKQLSKKGWKKDKPTCIVFEGISYYVNPEKFWQALKELKKNIKADCFICGDFLVDWTQQEVSKISKDLSLTVFEMIKDDCSQDYYPYTTKQLQKNLEELNFHKVQFFTQDEIQKERTGSYFPWDAGEGYIQLFTAQSD